MMPILKVLSALPPATAALVGCSAAGALVAETAALVGCSAAGALVAGAAGDVCPQAASAKLRVINKPSDVSHLFMKTSFFLYAIFSTQRGTSHTKARYPNCVCPTII